MRNGKIYDRLEGNSFADMLEKGVGLDKKWQASQKDNVLLHVHITAPFSALHRSFAGLIPLK